MLYLTGMTKQAWVLLLHKLQQTLTLRMDLPFNRLALVPHACLTLEEIFEINFPDLLILYTSQISPLNCLSYLKIPDRSNFA